MSLQPSGTCDATNKRIADKIELLKAADPQCLWFGVDTHRYRLGPRLSPTDAKSIGDRYGVTLPEDYAVFVTEVGNGGAGPGYGLQRLGFVESVTQITTAEARGPQRVVQKTRNGTLSRQDLFDASGKKVDPFDISFFESIKELAPDGEAGPVAPGRSFPLDEPLRNGEGDNKWAALNPSTGTLMLADYGCGMSAHLVLNGPFRGQIWLYDPNAGWFVPFSETATLHYVETSKVNATDAKTIFTFSSWYEHWIDHALSAVSREYETPHNTPAGRKQTKRG
jgi:hypothetical protein